MRKTTQRNSRVGSSSLLLDGGLCPFGGFILQIGGLEGGYCGFGGWVLWVHLWWCNGGQVTVPPALLLSPMFHPCSDLALLHPLLFIIGLQGASHSNYFDGIFWFGNPLTEMALNAPIHQYLCLNVQLSSFLL